MTLKEQKQLEIEKIFCKLDSDEELLDYFYSHRYVDSIEYFAHKYDTYKSIIQEYIKKNNIKKTSAQIKEQRIKTNMKQYASEHQLDQYARSNVLRRSYGYLPEQLQN